MRYFGKQSDQHDSKCYIRNSPRRSAERHEIQLTLCDKEDIKYKHLASSVSLNSLCAAGVSRVVCGANLRLLTQVTRDYGRSECCIGGKSMPALQMLHWWQVQWQHIA